MKAILEVETGIPMDQQMISLSNGRPINDNRSTINQYGINDNDMIFLTSLTASTRAFPGNLSGPDPFNVEYQRRIEETIRQQNINSNLQNALEYNPESFAQVHALYVQCFINKYPVKAFVDSGAQTTIISKKCAEECNILRLMDTRFQGIARGVGMATMLGRIHSAELKLSSNIILPCSFFVMDMDYIDLLLGLDMMRKHRMCIDLEQDVLRVHGDHVAFLPEYECPKPVFAASESTVQESSVQRLASLVPNTISRERVIRALQLANGNIDIAANILLGSDML